MAQYKAFDPNVEVLGEVVLSFVDVMGAFRRLALDILATHGIKDPRRDQWYPQQAWLNSFKTIAEQIGPNTLSQLARQIPISAKATEQYVEIHNLEQALSTLDMAYRSVHRGGEVGHYTFTKTGERVGRLETPNPNPCDFDRGLLDSLCHRFEPANPYLNVAHLDELPCKQQGADSCTFEISW